MSTVSPKFIAAGVLFTSTLGYSVYLHQGPIDSLRSENKNLQQEIEQLQETSRKKTIDQQSIVSHHVNRIGELEQRLATLDQGLIRLKGDKQRARTELQELAASHRAELAEKASQLQSIEESRAEQQAALELAQRETASLTEKLAGLRTQNDGLSQALRERKQALDAAKIRIAGISTELADAQDRHQQLSDQLANKEQKLTNSRQDYQQLQKRLDLLTGEKNELQRLQKALTSQLGMTKSQVEDLSRDASSREQELRTKEQQIRSMKLTQQELQLQFRRQIKEKEIQIDNLIDKLNIRLLDQILFASGSAEITPAGTKLLRDLAVELQKIAGYQITVAGHTDDIQLGPRTKDEFVDNLGLSVARAAAVSRTLVDNGVPPEILSAKGHSMYQPVMSNDSVEGRKQNRRVEIMLEPLR